MKQELTEGHLSSAFLCAAGEAERGHCVTQGRVLAGPVLTSSPLKVS